MTAVIILAAVCGASGQVAVTGITIDRYGDYWLDIRIGGDGYAKVSQWGELLDVESGERIDYYNSIFEQEDGRIKSVGSVRFEYYRSIFDYEDGKVKKIGNITFNYYNGFESELEGKLKKAGSHNIEYYSGFIIDDWKKGKPKRLCGIPVDFHDPRFARNGEEGLLKSIGPKNYTYQPQRGSRPPQINGQRRFETNGIRVRVVDRLY